VLIFYFASIISVRSTHLSEKVKDPDPYLWLMDPDPGDLKHRDPDPQQSGKKMESKPRRNKSGCETQHVR
jgi:hypothetical protein